jgi:hypothetical protein
VLAVVTSITGTGSLTVRAVRRRQHPAKGRLDILYEDMTLKRAPRTSIWNCILDSQNSNYIVIKTGLPTGLRRMVIECADERMSQKGQVYITLENDQKKAILNRVRFTRNVERRLDGMATDADSAY